MNLATALGFFSRMCSLESLEMLESWPGNLQMVQKHIKGRKIGLATEMGFPLSEAYSLLKNAKSVVRSVMVSLCRRHYSLHMAMVEASSQR